MVKNARNSRKKAFCRIGYQIATAAVAQTAWAASIYEAALLSDHAPLTIDYDMSL